MSDAEERLLLTELDIVNNWGYGVSVEKALVDEYIDARHARLTATERAQEATRKLRDAAIRPFFELNHRLLAAGMEPKNYALLPGTKRNAHIWINFRYRPATLDKIRAGGFEELVEKGYLVEQNEFHLDTEMIPEKNRAIFLLRLKELVKEFGIPEQAVQHSSGYVATSFFNQQRYQLLSVEKNLELQELIPAVIYIS